MLSYLLVADNKKQINSYLKQIINKDYFFYPIEIEEGKKEYSINQIKNIIKETVIYSDKIRVYYFENFHLSSIETQNSFLKLLEEPPNNVFFILTTDNLSKILPTIISRVKIVYLEKNHQLKIEYNKKKLINNFLTSKKLTLINADNLDFNDLLIYFRDCLKLEINKKTKKNNSKILKDILKTIYFVENNNINKQFALDNLLINIYKEINN